MKLLKNQVVLKDTMYNFHPTSGASDDYCKGLIVGAVSALMATGKSFDDSLEQCAICMPETSRLMTKDCVPESWVADTYRYFITSHRLRPRE